MELHKYIVQSGQMPVVQLILLEIRGLEIGKLRKMWFSVPFCLGLCLRTATPRVKGHLTCVTIGTAVSEQARKEAKSARPELSLTSVCRGLGRGSRAADFTLPCTAETVVYTAK